MGWPEWSVAHIMTERPGVRVNQLGYLLGRPKQATLVSDAAEPVHFTVRDRDGVVVHTGLSQPWSARPEPASGLNVHVLDFTRLNTRGAGFRIEAGDQYSHPFEVTSRLYDTLAADAVALLLSDAVWDTDLGPGRAGLWTAGRTSRATTESWRSGGACVDGARRASAVPGLAL
jgi:Cellulase N-terminal ig-like domain